MRYDWQSGSPSRNVQTGLVTVRSGTRHQIYYFRRVIHQISKRSIVEFDIKLLHSKSNVKHEETFFVSSMLLVIAYMNCFDYLRLK